MKFNVSSINKIERKSDTNEDTYRHIQCVIEHNSHSVGNVVGKCLRIINIEIHAGIYWLVFLSKHCRFSIFIMLFSNHSMTTVIFVKMDLTILFVSSFRYNKKYLIKIWIFSSIIIILSYIKHLKALRTRFFLKQVNKNTMGVINVLPSLVLCMIIE